MLRNLTNSDGCQFLKPLEPFLHDVQAFAPEVPRGEVLASCAFDSNFGFLAAGGNEEFFVLLQEVFAHAGGHRVNSEGH